ncbi:Type IV secretory pathway, VirD4 component, TraG/TraD family ATPase [Variovorax sp. HW608]|uniref:type IV secretion system DNA-binding domain-containing protein n=1 Tax=Variovorax sp. HW608 TaxID=1034889 RepID=UPI00081F9E9D|nr:type IV secretion system DNA-binding domain-containing protein [Variovorax sp. HW608]SCK09140.1 Type IV secretory pathway, VirD4 component, TraG/TraD family ATPase [Variovorax sp. HW608]
MQRHEVENATMAFGVALPMAGWWSGAYLGNVPLSPFPRALTEALNLTPHHPIIMGGLLAGLAAAAGVAYLLHEYGDDKFRGAPYRRWMRGSRMANWHAVRRQVLAANRLENNRRRKANREAKPLPPIMVGRMPMPLHLENRNTLICASVGAGKSVAMEAMIFSAVRRRDRMAVIDPNGTFFSKFSFPGDTILNPFDKRSAGWTIFNEIQGVHDFSRMAKSVIPPQVDPNDEQWCAYTRDVLADTMRKLHETGNPDQETLVNLLVREDGDVIRAFLANTDSQGYFRENAEKAIASIQFMMNKYVRPLRFMTRGQFSLHKWVHDPKAGNLFITWREDMRAAQRPLVATWIDTICATILSNEPMTDTRLWLFLDELESLGKLESFVPAATKGRKHGLRIVGSIQDWAQLDETYGKDSAKTLLACFRNYLIFGASNALNADKASEILGKQHVERINVTQTVGKGGGGSRQLVASQPEPVVMDSEISNLKDLDGYVMFAEDFPIAKIHVAYREYPRRANPIEILDDGLSNSKPEPDMSSTPSAPTGADATEPPRRRKARTAARSSRPRDAESNPTLDLFSSADGPEPSAPPMDISDWVAQEETRT